MSKVIEYLESGGVMKASIIANKLDMDEKVVEMILKQLEQMGRIETAATFSKDLTNCTPVACKGCAIKDSCESENQPRLLMFKKDNKT
jgi:hypothetical protein